MDRDKEQLKEQLLYERHYLVEYWFLGNIPKPTRRLKEIDKCLDLLEFESVVKQPYVQRPIYSTRRWEPWRRKRTKRNYSIRDKKNIVF